MLPWKITACLRPGCQVVLKPFQQRASNSSNTTSVRAVFVVSHCALLSRTLIMSKPFSFQFVTHNLWHISSQWDPVNRNDCSHGRANTTVPGRHRIMDLYLYLYLYIYIYIYVGPCGTEYYAMASVGGKNRTIRS